MNSVLLARKGKTTHLFDAQGKRVPATVLDVSDVYLCDIKTKEKDGYFAVKLSQGIATSIDKPTKKALEAKGLTITPRVVKEFRVSDEADGVIKYDAEANALQLADSTIALGAHIDASKLFQIGDVVAVTSISKGKGFQGVVKRHGFHGGPKTHGQSDRWRAPGSMGSSTTPGRTHKGKRMAGRMGGDRVTVKNLKVLAIDNGLLTVSGLIPGNVDTLVELRSQKRIS